MCEDFELPKLAKHYQKLEQSSIALIDSLLDLLKGFLSFLRGVQELIRNQFSPHYYDHGSKSAPDEIL